MNKQMALEDVLGEVVSIEKLPEQGCTSEVSRVVTESGTYLLKSAFKQKYREWLKAEAAVLQNLSEKLIPVPEYHGFYEEKESSHLIMSFEQGVTLTAALRAAETQTEKISLIRSFGRLLQKLHEGELIFQCEGDWLDRQLARAQVYAESGQSDGNLELLEQLKSSRPAAVKQTMIHGDCTTDNVLVTDGEVRMFIDVAGMTVGDPRYDEALAIGRFTGNSEWMSAFYEGYTRYKITQAELEYFNDGLYEFF
ncbi:phosphotransferase [Mesobacillus subterraneus]|uniref:Aminoglycoside phosphotransferase family protein n=1 Tax=Mesobacillus subterraneus TaxID=285983 RepID=A0A3R9DW58_9BACI|nr:phosphotransferase [Mesobacillus subterraneus]RSD28776.1 aminoglycoside phosphotransferase family protein [Mesobacillus subterraneus]